MKHLFLIIFLVISNFVKAQEYVINNNNSIGVTYSWINEDNSYKIEIAQKNAYITSCVAIGGESGILIKKYKNGILYKSYRDYCNANMCKIRLYMESINLLNLDTDNELEFMVVYECMSCNLDDRNLKLLIIDDNAVIISEFGLKYDEHTNKFVLMEKMNLPNDYKEKMNDFQIDILLDRIINKNNIMAK